MHFNFVNDFFLFFLPETLDYFFSFFFTEMRKRKKEKEQVVQVNVR